MGAGFSLIDESLHQVSTSKDTRTAVLKCQQALKNLRGVKDSNLSKGVATMTFQRKSPKCPQTLFHTIFFPKANYWIRPLIKQDVRVNAKSLPDAIPMTMASRNCMCILRYLVLLSSQL